MKSRFYGDEVFKGKNTVKLVSKINEMHPKQSKLNELNAKLSNFNKFVVFLLLFLPIATLSPIFFTCLLLRERFPHLKLIKCISTFLNFLIDNHLKCIKIYVFKVCGIEIYVKGDVPQINKFHLIIGNHLTCWDWLFYLALSQGRNDLDGKLKFAYKQEIDKKFFYGIALRFIEGCALTRQYAKDEKILQKYLLDLDTTTGNKLLFFPEAMILRPDKLKKSNQYAAENDLPQMEHCLYPRVRGILQVLSHYHKSGTQLEILDVTSIIHSDRRFFEVEHVFEDVSNVKVFLDAKSYNMSELFDDNAFCEAEIFKSKLNSFWQAKNEKLLQTKCLLKATAPEKLGFNRYKIPVSDYFSSIFTNFALMLLIVKFASYNLNFLCFTILAPFISHKFYKLLYKMNLFRQH